MISYLFYKFKNVNKKHGMYNFNFFLSKIFTFSKPYYTLNNTTSDDTYDNTMFYRNINM